MQKSKLRLKGQDDAGVITPEMMTAGVKVLWDSGTVDGQSEADKLVVREIFEAMALANHLCKKPTP